MRCGISMYDVDLSPSAAEPGAGAALELEPFCRGSPSLAYMRWPATGSSDARTRSIVPLAMAVSVSTPGGGSGVAGICEGPRAAVGTTSALSEQRARSDASEYVAGAHGGCAPAAPCGSLNIRRLGPAIFACDCGSLESSEG